MVKSLNTNLTDRELKAARKAAKRERKERNRRNSVKPVRELKSYSNKKKKLAFCFSGQLRTWNSSIGTWQILFDELKEKHNVSVIDVFCHIWDHNTVQQGIKHATESEVITTSVPDDEITRYIEQLKPVSYKIDDIIASKKAMKDTQFQTVIDSNAVSRGKYNAWLSPQFYSVMYAAHLKRRYEIENDFHYDACVRMRNDLFLNDRFRECLPIETFLNPEFNTMYSCHSGIDESVWFRKRLGDVFWYADSPTFDKLSNFYHWFPNMPLEMTISHDAPPEHLLYYYTRMCNISIDPNIVHYVSVCRDADYAKKKEAAGLGPLGEHEVQC